MRLSPPSPSSPCSPCPARRPPRTPRASTEPVVLTGAQPGRPGGAVPSYRRACRCWTSRRPPTTRTTTTRTPTLDTARAARRRGHADRPPARLPLGPARQFVQIPFQVDEVFTRYLDNSASGFSPYSGEDQHTTYAYDREGFRYTQRAARRRPVPRDSRASPAATDPVKGLDTNDELAFMAADAGAAGAGGRARCPHGHRRRARSSRSPTRRTRRDAELRLRHAAPRRAAPQPAFDAANGYVRYQRDANADTLRVLGVHATTDYGNARQGLVLRRRRQRRARRRRHAEDRPAPPARHRDDHDAALPLPLRRPLADDRRSQIAPSDGGSDATAPTSSTAGRRARSPRTRARETPCCGYEEEDTNWGGSSIAARRARRPGPRDPRDVGRRLRHQRHPPRDLLPRPDGPEELAARARDPAARRHLRAVGLQRRPRDALLQRAQHRDGVDDRRPQRRGVRQPRRPVQPALRRQRHERVRPELPHALPRAAVLRRLPYHLQRRPERPDVHRRQRRARAGRRSPAPNGDDRRPHLRPSRPT